MADRLLNRDRAVDRALTTTGRDATAHSPMARRKSLLPLLASTLALIAIAAAFTQGGNVEVFTAVQSATVRLPDPFWSIVTICGTGVMAFAILSPTLPWRPRWFAAAAVAAAPAGLFSTGLKHLYGLPRPAAVLDAAHLHVVGHALRSNTFPSGHTITAFTLASVLVFASRRPLKTAAWTVPLALAVAVSRIAVGAHWPADLAAGAAGGWIAGALGVAIVDRWRQWNTAIGVRILGLVSIGIGISLFVVDLGYPQALAAQYLWAVVAIVAGAATVARPRLESTVPSPRSLAR